MNQTCKHNLLPRSRRMKENNLIDPHETHILGGYGISDVKRTPWTIFTASIWLMWWNMRLWLAKRGLFVKKVYYDESNL